MYTKFTLGRSIGKSRRISRMCTTVVRLNRRSVRRVQQSVPVIVSTNVFGYEDPTPEGRISRILFISQWLKDNVAVGRK